MTKHTKPLTLDMRKRQFLKTLGLGGLSLVAARALPLTTLVGPGGGGQDRKYWSWVTTDLWTSDEEWKKRFALLRQSGINAVLLEAYDSHYAYYQSKHLPVKEPWLERLLPLAAAEGLEVHAWMWSMPCNVEQVRNEHPDWFVVNRKGESAAVKPAYVDYYRFLCPSRPGVHEFVRTTVAEFCSYEGLSGVHLDYIRYPDVILPEALQPKYGIKQDREYPQYDYCYCDVCRAEFEKVSGIDPLKIENPSANAAWRQFRQDRVTSLVNNVLIPTARSAKKQITAAVFPNWQNVRQEWPKWNLDAALPMLYHTLYGKDTEWIRQETEKGVRSLPESIPLYSGLLVFRLSPEDVAKAVRASLKGGARGVSIFSAQAMSEAKWRSFRDAIG
jgi:uncharacterized lipoprotein YddW (UPF0748 family)